MSFILDEEPRLKKPKNPLLVLLLIGFILSFIMGLGIFYYAVQTEEVAPVPLEQMQPTEVSQESN
jgi:hypothetical protein